MNSPNLVSITGNPNQKPSIKAGVYSDNRKIFAFNRKAAESQNVILTQKNYKKICPQTIFYGAMLVLLVFLLKGQKSGIYF